MDNDGIRVSASDNKGLNGDDGGVLLAEGRVAETDVPSLEMNLGDKSVAVIASGESVLGVEKKGNSVENIGDGSDRKVKYNGNSISLVVEVDVHASLKSGNESKRILRSEDDEVSFGDEIGGIQKLELSEINTSSMSKEGRNGDRTGERGDVNAIDENEDDSSEDVDDEDHEYQVGDFVWGKIRSYPWWPGQIYDPSDASKYAARYKQNGRFLVAYFGDGSFSWCNSSQLKPFVENFEKMSKQSNSKSFVNAVQKALEEISRHVELEMTCSCLPAENQIMAARNGGIKAGVLVPLGGIRNFLIDQHEPKELLASLRNAAQEVGHSNMLDFTLTKSWLTAYYRAKGGYSLLMYHEPIGIEGFEDKNIDVVMDTNDTSNPVEVPVQGPSEEVWSPVEVCPQFNQLNEPLMRKCPEILDDILYERRKQKSVAELMDTELDKKGNMVKATKSVTLSSGKGKMKGDEEAEKQGKTLFTSESGMKRGRKRKVEVSESPILNDENSGVLGEENNETPLSREPKRKKLSNVENGKSKSKEDTVKSMVSRERKRSRYLSPPYTVSSNKRDTKSEAKKITETQMGEQTTSQLIRSPQNQNGSNATFHEEHPEEIGCRHEKSGRLSSRTDIQDYKKAIASLDVNATSEELLSVVRSAALDPLCLKENSYLDLITEHISAFRNSFFSNGLNYKVFKKIHRGRKRRSLNIKAGPPQQGLDLAVHEPSESRSQQQTVNETNGYSNLEMSLVKQADKVSEIKANDGDAERRAPSVALILTFPPAFSLPSKAELIQIFGKFGALNEMETDVLYMSYCARVSFVRSSDAEEAFNASLERSPFGAANVNYRLRYPSTALRVQESNQKCSSSLGKTLENVIASQASDEDEASKIGFIRKKLEMMTSMLDTCDGRISVEMKSNLESEMKGLLEKVSLLKS